MFDTDVQRSSGPAKVLSNELSPAAPTGPTMAGDRRGPRICHVCTDFFPAIGGIERFIEDLIRHSVGAGIEHHVICFDRTRGTAGRPETASRHRLLARGRIKGRGNEQLMSTFLPTKLECEHPAVGSLAVYLRCRRLNSA